MTNIGFVHGSKGIGRISLVHTKAGLPDSEGRVVNKEVIQDIPSARFCILSAREQQRESRPGQDVDAVLLVPNGTLADEGDIVRVALKDPYLDGDWRVLTVRSAVIHLRVMCGKRGV